MKTALVLLDIQSAILDPKAIAFQEPMRPGEVVAAASALAAAAREAGVPVIHVGVARSQARGCFDTLRTQAALASGKAPRDVLALAPGSEGGRFLVAPRADEEVIYKMGVSAFAGTRLDAVLRNLQVSDVVVAGAFTHMVVESTVRAGFDLGYRMIVARDACCSPAPAPHEHALATGIPNFALVQDCAALLRAWAGCPARGGSLY